jgi:energy-coupling factor transporter ATP-binding protein EcfA2
VKLKTVRTQNYKSIDDSGEFSIDGITCLAGKNESGKTALLQALRRLNPVEPGEAAYDVTMEFPRRRRRDFDKAKPANVLTTTWELDDADVKVVEDTFGKDVLRSRTITVRKGYSGRTFWDVDVDPAAAVKHVVDNASELSDAQRVRAQGQPTFPALAKVLTSLGATRSQVETTLLEQITDYEERYPSSQVIKALNARLPKFLYFDTYGKLDGVIALEPLAQRIEAGESPSTGENIFLALLELAGTSLDEIRNAQATEQLIAELEAASNAVSDEIFEYWSQNRHLQVQASIGAALPEDPPPMNQGMISRIRVRNNRHRVTVGFDERSAGFVWFFSFLVWFSQMKKNYGDQLVILLDEPGLNLHASAQGDLLRFMRERLEPSYQVIYTTHSPFMIDPSRILSVRTVEDVERNEQLLGTKVGDKVLSTDSATLFPLRAALGYEITQTLFVGEHSLVVEGPSDFLYLQWASSELKRLDREGLDTKWTITPAGGIDKIPSFIALFGGANLHIATLTDFHQGDKGKVERLRQSELLRNGHVLSADTFAEQAEADTEDLLGRALYIELINRTYELTPTELMPSEKAGSTPIRVEAEVREHLRTKGARDFDHFEPAAFLIEHAADFRDASGIETALDRFEQFFVAVNGLLD